MNCRKTGNQMKNRICTQNNKRIGEEQGEGDDHAIFFETVANSRDWITIVITQRQPVNKLKKKTKTRDVVMHLLSRAEEYINIYIYVCKDSERETETERDGNLCLIFFKASCVPHAYPFHRL